MAGVVTGNLKLSAKNKAGVKPIFYLSLSTLSDNCVYTYFIVDRLSTFYFVPLANTTVKRFRVGRVTGY